MLSNLTLQTLRPIYFNLGITNNLELNKTVTWGYLNNHLTKCSTFFFVRGLGGGGVARQTLTVCDLTIFEDMNSSLLKRVLELVSFNLFFSVYKLLYIRKQLLRSQYFLPFISPSCCSCLFLYCKGYIYM